MSQTPIDFFLPEVALGDALSPETSLDVPYLKQTASNWCWATSAAMVSRFIFGQAIKICEVASTLIDGQECCNSAPDEGSVQTNADPDFVHKATPCNRTISVTEVAKLYSLLRMQCNHRASKISFADIADQIVRGHPVEVAFIWIGGGGHVAVVRAVMPSAQMVRINDPWPDTGEVIVPFSELETAYGKGKWFDCWTDIQSIPEVPSNGSV
jgi:hypothetical protein